MENELRNAFYKIHAADTLKNNTARYLNMEIYKRSQIRTLPRLRLATLCSAILLFIFIGGFSYNLYFTPDAYVDVDVNPSIGLALNRFDRVIGVNAYNDDGALILAEANIRHKTYSEATRILFDIIFEKGYLIQDALISVTVQTGGDESENNMLESLNQVVTNSLSEHHANAQTEIFPITNDVRINANEHHISPAKYLAILELQSVDPTATFESCGGHSIGEIRDRTQGHGGSHHDEGRETPYTDDSDNNGFTPISPNTHDNGRHGDHHQH